MHCTYCDMSFRSPTALRKHCESEEHQLIVMSDQGHDWKYRPPPRGFKPSDYTLCRSWSVNETCNYSSSCTEAHGSPELTEWINRFEYRAERLRVAREKKLYGKSRCDEINQRLAEMPDPLDLMKDRLPDVECHNGPLTIFKRKGEHKWKFTLKSELDLRYVVLLDDAHRNHFVLSAIRLDGTVQNLKYRQEWDSRGSKAREHVVTVKFSSRIFGTFQQTLLFDFDTGDYLVKKLKVDVVPADRIEQINEIKDEITKPLMNRWTKENSNVIGYRNETDEWNDSLRSEYPSPPEPDWSVSVETIEGREFTRNNYRVRMHDLLYVEEIARSDMISRFNLRCKVLVAKSYILTPYSVSASAAKFSAPGELFGVIRLGEQLSEDSCAGKLILMYCQNIFVARGDDESIIFELPIEDKTKNSVYFKFSAEVVETFGLQPDGEIGLQVQFQLNLIPFCQYHYAVDRMQNLDILFPEVDPMPQIPWSPERHWSRDLDARLNVKQREAVIAATTPLDVRLPPILVIGPYGTGKTFTMAQIVLELVRDPDHKILLCTHSNSAADLYVKEYFDKWIDGGNRLVRPVRIYYEKRWVSTVHPAVLKYCLVNSPGQSAYFRTPTRADVARHNVIVATLSTSLALSRLALPRGSFTHVLIDEAAQALECEALAPLLVAGRATRVVLAGDHMQTAPRVHSSFAAARRLDESLLERLRARYPRGAACAVALCENYRSHPGVIEFASACFYEQRLVARGRQPRHAVYHPLTFFTTLGEDVQDVNSTAFYNTSEVYEVIERVKELRSEWPTEWGAFDEHSIGVVTPYVDQVFRIRSELRKKRIDDVCVERVQNVQGKQFRVIFISTVRTRWTAPRSDGELDFLSEPRLLNTAITRAQSLIAVVGDPVALCSLGRCAKIWERFVRTADDNRSLFGITWPQLKLRLDGIELKKIYSLNPLAPEFVPRNPIPPPTFVPAPSIAPTPLSDCLDVLPSNMSLADMLSKSGEFHEMWYEHLRKAAGAEAAQKFRFLIQVTTRRGLLTVDDSMFRQDLTRRVNEQFENLEINNRLPRMSSDRNQSRFVQYFSGRT